MSSVPQNISMCLELESKNSPSLEKNIDDKENICTDLAKKGTNKVESTNCNGKNGTEDQEPALNRVVDIIWEERVITPLKDIPPLGYAFTQISQEVRFVEEPPLTHFTQFVNGDEELIFYLEMD